MAIITYRLPQAACYQTTTVREILAVLNKCPNKAIVLFDFAGFRPGDFESYRGYYECLCIEPLSPDVKIGLEAKAREPETVASFYLRLS